MDLSTLPIVWKRCSNDTHDRCSTRASGNAYIKPRHGGKTGLLVPDSLTLSILDTADVPGQSLHRMVRNITKHPVRDAFWIKEARIERLV